jgi:hypothetical protein
MVANRAGGEMRVVVGGGSWRGREWPRFRWLHLSRTQSTQGGVALIVRDHLSRATQVTQPLGAYQITATHNLFTAEPLHHEATTSRHFLTPVSYTRSSPSYPWWCNPSTPLLMCFCFPVALWRAKFHHGEVLRVHAMNAGGECRYSSPHS